MGHTLALVVGAVAFSTGQLFFGILIGVRLARARNEESDTTDEGTNADNDPSLFCKACLAFVDFLSDSAKELNAACGKCRPPVPDHITSLARELQGAILELQTRISGESELADAAAVFQTSGRCLKSDAEHTSQPAGQDRENRTRGTEAGDQEPGMALRPDGRSFFYSAVGYMATCDEESLPDPTRFRSVQCHALSGRGISFYADTPPDYSWLTIAFGAPGQEVFVMCRVHHCREVFLEHHRQYLINCDFVRRLSSDAIELPASLTTGNAATALPAPSAAEVDRSSLRPARERGRLSRRRSF